MSAYHSAPQTAHIIARVCVCVCARLLVHQWLSICLCLLCLPVGLCQSLIPICEEATLQLKPMNLPSQVEKAVNKLTLQMPHQLFIGGKFVDAAGTETYATVNPTDGSVSAGPALASLLPPTVPPPVTYPPTSPYLTSGVLAQGTYAWTQKCCSQSPVVHTGIV